MRTRQTFLKRVRSAVTGRTARRSTRRCATTLTVPDELPPPTPAATVIVVRDTADQGGIDVLLLRRSAFGAFPNMWVFPGGRVDTDDAGDDELTTARSAAVREAREEVGVVLDPATLVPFSHWTPPAIQPRRFSTWFFLAPWAGDDVTIDGHEIVDHCWMRPADVLQAALPMAPPTIVTVHDLLTVASAGSFRRADPPRYVTVAGRSADGRPVLMWHGDAGYDSGDADAPGPRHRLYYDVTNPNAPYTLDL